MHKLPCQCLPLVFQTRVCRLLLARLSGEEYSARVAAALVRQMRRVPDAALGALLGLLALSPSIPSSAAAQQQQQVSGVAAGQAALLEQLVPVVLQQLRWVQRA